MDEKHLHLEFILRTITRMATNSFLFKGWAVSLAVGLMAFAAVRDSVLLFVTAGVSTLLFWSLDAYYLWLERGFVDLFKEVPKRSEGEFDFSSQESRHGRCALVGASHKPSCL